MIPDANEAYQSRLQDWRTWLDQSLFDVLCPMAYTPDPKLFETQVALAQEYAAGRPVWTGIGAVGTVIIGILRFGVSASPFRLFCVGLIVGGLVGLRFAPGHR